MFKGKTFLENLFLIYLSIVLPFSFSLSLIDATLSTRALTLGVFVTISLILILVDSTLRKDFVSSIYNHNIVVGLFLIFLIWCAVTGFDAFSKTSFFFGLAKNILYFLFLLLGLFLFEKSNLFKIFRALVLFTFFGLIVGVYQYIKFSDLTLVSSLFSNKNLFASLLLFLLPILFYTYKKDQNKYWKNLAMFVFFGSEIFIVLLNSRAVWISFVLLMMMLIPIAWKKNWLVSTLHSLKNLLLIILLPFLILIITKVDFSSSKEHLPKEKINSVSNTNSSSINEIETIDEKKENDKVYIDGNEQTGSFETRYKLMQSTIKMIKEYPIAGVGLRNWKVVFPKYGLAEFKRDAQQGLTNYQRAHNDWLQLIAETGFVGFILFISIIIVALFYLIKTNKIFDYQIVGLLVLIAISVIMLFDFPRERIEHNLILMIALVLMIKNDIKTEKKVKYTFLIPLLVLCSIAGTYVSYIVLRGEFNMRKIEIFHKTQQWQNMSLLAAKTHDQYYDINPYSIPIRWYEGVASFSVGNVQKALVDFQKAAKVHPYNINVLNNVASANYQLGKIDSALFYYNRVLEISPYYDEALINKSIIYYNAKNYIEALNTISNCYIGTSHYNYKKVLTAVLLGYLNSIDAKTELQQRKLDGLKSDQQQLIKIYRSLYLNNKTFEAYINEQIIE